MIKYFIGGNETKFYQRSVHYSRLLSGLLVLQQTVDRAECQAGYDYAPPPAEVQLRPQGGGASKPQADGGHGHDSDDPLAWLRESVPGENHW